MSPGNKAHFIVSVAIMLLGALIILGIIFIPPSISKTISDFSILWNTTDALQHHLASTKQWPCDWNALSPSLAFVEPAYSDRDISFVKTRLEINFDVDIGSPTHANEWYVRLKGGNLKLEQENANKRIRDLIEKIKQPTELDRY